MERGDEDADKRREAAIASLQSNFKPKNISETQLSKFQELHKRRLQIKAKSNVHKKPKGKFDGKGKFHKKAVDEEPKQSVGDSFNDQSSINGVGDNSSTVQHVEQKTAVVKQRKKLHWGLTQENGGNASPICNCQICERHILCKVGVFKGREGQHCLEISTFRAARENHHLTILLNAPVAM